MSDEAEAETVYANPRSLTDLVRRAATEDHSVDVVLTEGTYEIESPLLLPAHVRLVGQAARA